MLASTGSPSLKPTRRKKKTPTAGERKTKSKAVFKRKLKPKIKAPVKSEVFFSFVFSLLALLPPVDAREKKALSVIAEKKKRKKTERTKKTAPSKNSAVL